MTKQTSYVPTFSFVYCLMLWPKGGEEGVVHMGVEDLRGGIRTPGKMVWQKGKRGGELGAFKLCTRSGCMLLGAYG